ncbi:MAG: hypothetical protein GYB35_02510 [Algicola sp.]|nr:hypothetical protein [Algicola sp.]
MKKIYLLKSLMFFLLFSACTETQILDEELRNVNPITLDSDDPCYSTTLYAGQHNDAGMVTVQIDEDNLIVTFSSNEDWTIELTHLALGNCDEDWVPLTGSGNPQIGQFEFTDPFSITPHEVIYILSMEDLNLNENFCFAAHAEVDGLTGGETAWAQGTEFDGNSWAMFSEVTECEEDDDGGSNTPF